MDKVIDTILEELTENFTGDERQCLEEALQFIVGRQAIQGTPPSPEEGCYGAVHVQEVLTLLSELDLDAEAMIAAVLYGGLDSISAHKKEIDALFGRPLSTLLLGVEKMDIRPGYDFEVEGDFKVRAEQLRRMLIAMVDDVRVVPIRLAHQLACLRLLSSRRDRERYRQLARETLELYAPLANRLGIWQLKWELEDLSFKALEPDRYRQLAASLREKRADRQGYIDSFLKSLKHELEAVSLNAQVSGRPKHIYSIWKKMVKKDIDIKGIYDITATRIIVPDVAACYGALGVVHTLWSPIPGEFDDYIATPKENNYQSIHTAVIGPGGKPVEVQIRTHEMHRDNELGIAAHWRYKEGNRKTSTLDGKIRWLRQLLEWKEEISDAGFVNQFQSEIAEERIYIFTPRGTVIDLPMGATPIDFAYAVHTEIGHRCRGAKVNGKIVPLTYELQTGEQVEVLTSTKGGPSRDWLSLHHGYLKTNRARSRVQRWFKQENYDQNLSAGRVALDRELHRLGLSDVKLEGLARDKKYKRVDDFLAAIGSGDLTTAHAVSRLRHQLAEKATETESPPLRKRSRQNRDAKGLQIQGVGNIMTTTANCCGPVPGDSVVGYITQGRGITIHTRECANLARLQHNNPDRLIQVQWGDEEETYPVVIEVYAYDRQGLLHDITRVLTDIKVNLVAAETRSNAKELVATMRLTVEIPDIDVLSQVLSHVDLIPNVIEVRRVNQ